MRVKIKFARCIKFVFPSESSEGICCWKVWTDLVTQLLVLQLYSSSAFIACIHFMHVHYIACYLIYIFGLRNKYHNAFNQHLQQPWWWKGNTSILLLKTFVQSLLIMNSVVNYVMYCETNLCLLELKPFIHMARIKVSTVVCSVVRWVLRRSLPVGLMLWNCQFKCAYQEISSCEVPALHSFYQCEFVIFLNIILHDSVSLQQKIAILH
jgi:hypothetical protein